MKEVRSHQFLNSWEQGPVGQEDDIKEELSHDESAVEKHREEGSAARKLLESIRGRNGFDDRLDFGGK